MAGVGGTENDESAGIGGGVEDRVGPGRGAGKMVGAYVLMKKQVATCPQWHRQPGRVICPRGSGAWGPQWWPRMKLEGDKK